MYIQVSTKFNISGSAECRASIFGALTQGNLEKLGVPKMLEISLALNGTTIKAKIKADMTLLEFLRT